MLVTLKFLEILLVLQYKKKDINSIYIRIEETFL